VCAVTRELADGAAVTGQCVSTLVVLHGMGADFEAPSVAKLADLNVRGAGGPEVFASLGAWLEQEPQDVIFLNDVSDLWPFLPYFPQQSRVVVVLHDEGRRYLDPVVRQADVLDGFVVVARYLLKVLARGLRASRPPTRVIHNGTNFPVAPARGPCDSRRSVRLLYMGGLDFFKKGVQDLPAVLRRLTKRGVDCELSVIGGENLRLRALFERAGVPHRVRWVDWLPRASCFELAADHDIILIPSRCEAFGMVAIEAMGMGCVPVAYDIPSGLREIIRNEETGCLVRFPRPAALADAIETLACNPERLEAMSRAATEDVRSRFSAERAGSEYVSFARMLLRIPAEKRSSQEVAALVRRSKAPGPSVAPARVFLRRTVRRMIEPYPRLVRWSWRHLTG
jgi:glycosyltransferase involved in cell wall biosynthesis